jgi:hypothetical protein
MIDSLKNNEDLLNKLKHNSKDNVEALFDTYFDEVMI